MSAFPSPRSRQQVSAYRLTEDRSWRDRAACEGTRPGFFYPVDDEGRAAAKAVCAGCPVAEACLEHAIAVREKHGVWGGMDEADRDREIRRRQHAYRTRRKGA